MKALTLSRERWKLAIPLAKNHSVDLILLDVMMPHMDGFQALQEIRSLSKKMPLLC